MSTKPARRGHLLKKAFNKSLLSPELKYDQHKTKPDNVKKNVTEDVPLNRKKYHSPTKLLALLAWGNKPDMKGAKPKRT